ncbi:MAG: hypothetical protein AMJ79_02945 [Phycisphaerae bacterium SM23_30]|nr:MAG: hypothetical protein AMJ79_02945 [Phycisphaerae bacterium SM23_30]
MDKFWIITCFTAVVLVSSCAQPSPTSNLVQPQKWWSVHPRPVYAALEHVGTFQNWFEVYKITEGTYALYEPYQFEEAICYLVEGQNRAALIDTGTGIGDLKKLVQKLTDLPVFVILTHEHYDHVADAYQFDEIIMYDNDLAVETLKKGRSNASLQRYIAKDYLWNKPLPQGFDPDAWTIPPMEPTDLVRENDIIDLGGRRLEVIYTPGHSPGQMCLLDRQNRLLFTGDHFFPGPLYAHASDVNIDDYIASNKKLCQRINEFDYLCSGHNDPYVKSEVLLRVSEAFDTIFAGGGQFAQDSTGLRRYKFDGFDILIRADMIR